MKKISFAVLILIVIIIGLLHFFTPGHLVFYHDTYRRLSYFPIVIGALLFGARGGLLLAIMSSFFFIPHLLLYIGKSPASYLSELTEVILYLAAGTVTGIIAGRESRLRAKYEQLSEKLEKSYRQLHQEAELLIEVEEQLSASQKLSALGQLSASLAHEIKNPLSSIKGTAEILLDEIPVEHPRREFVEIMLKEINRLNSTVEDVLRYSREQSPGRLAGNGAVEPVSKVAGQVARLLKSRLEEKAIDLEISGIEAGDDFLVEPGKMSQVFLNLFLNAIDAVPRKGRIMVRFTKEDNGLAIAVADNGPGIQPDDADKIFKQFYSKKEDGTGLGLPISRKILESHGGSLTVSKASEGGACFTIFLPS